MKNLLIWTSVLLYICASCSPKTKSAAEPQFMVGPALSYETTVMWVAPSKGGTIHTPVGVMTTEDCYKIDSRTNLKPNAVTVKKYFASSHSNQEFLCHEIEGFDYQEGNVYQIEVHRSFENNALTGVSLNKIFFIETDPTFSKEETINMWVHNDVKAGAKAMLSDHVVKDSPGRIFVQYGKTLDTKGEFIEIDAPKGYEHNPKYISNITIKRNHISTQDESNYNDSDQSFNDTYVQTNKKLVGKPNSKPVSIVQAPNIAYAKSTRKTVRTSYSKSTRSQFSATSSSKSASSSSKSARKSTSKIDQATKAPINIKIEKDTESLVPESISIEEVTMWINSSRDGELSWSDEGGVYQMANCYEVNYNAELRKNSFGDINVFDYENEVKPLCHEINGLDYEPGYIYLVNATKSYYGDKVDEVSLDRIITKEFDRSYEKIEILDVWIDAETQTGIGLHGNEQEYLKVQFGEKLNPNEKWQGLSYISGFDHKTGYVTHIKIKRSHMSAFEAATIADHKGYEDTMLEVIEMYKKPVIEDNTNQNAGMTKSKTKRTAIKKSYKKRTVKSSSQSSSSAKKSSSSSKGPAIKNSTNVEISNNKQGINTTPISENQLLTDYHESSCFHPDPNYFEPQILWIHSTRDGELKTSSDAGISVEGGCYKYSEDKDVDQSSNERFFSIANLPIKVLCEEIVGFDFKSGYMYKLIVSNAYDEKKQHYLKLDEVLLQEEDPHHNKIEYSDMWIGPSTETLRGSHGQKYESLMVQYGESFDRNGKWKYEPQIDGLDYKPGFLYHIKVKTTYASTAEIGTNTHPSYKSIELLKLVSKRKI